MSVDLVTCNYSYKYKKKAFIFFLSLRFSQVKWKPNLLLRQLIFTFALSVANTS